VGEGDTFEDLLERQLRLHSNNQEVYSLRRSLPGKPHPFLRRGKGIARFRVQHRGQRSSSRPVTTTKKTQDSRTATHSPKKPPTGELHKKTASGTTPLLGSRFSSDESFIFRGTQREKQEEAELAEFELLERAATDSTSFSECSLVKGVLRRVREGREGEGSDGEVTESLPPDEGSVRGAEEEEEERSPSPDLDKTLTPSQTEGGVKGQSLAAGIVFSDEEEWESFSHGSPPPPSSQQEEQMRVGERDSGTSPALSMKPKPVSSTPLSTSPAPEESGQDHRQHTGTETPVPDSSVEPLPPPPPSALAARLFPALRRERERMLLQQKQWTVPQPAAEKTTPTVATPPHPSEPELREKLCELETEIERFKAMNSRLEAQSKEKEQVCRCSCVSFTVALYTYCVCVLAEFGFSAERDCRVPAENETGDGAV
jgi:hypothetical protein